MAETDDQDRDDGVRQILALVSDELKDGGFFYDVRHLNFAPEKGREIAKRFAEVNLTSDADFIAFTKAVWRLPNLLTAWEDRCIQCGADPRQYVEVRSLMTDAISRAIQDYEQPR